MSTEARDPETGSEGAVPDGELGPEPSLDPSPPPETSADAGRDRLIRSLRRPSRGQAVVAVILGLLAFAAVTQVRITGQDDTYSGLRQSELIQALNGLTAASNRAERDITTLEGTRDSLLNSTERRATALKRAREEAETLGVLAGTLPATGPGVRITIVDKSGRLGLNHLLDGIEELRDAGAEAIEINDRVRVVAQTSFEDSDEGILVDGTLLRSPYTIDAIGSPATLAGALVISGGFQDDVVSIDKASFKAKQSRSIEISVTRKAIKPRYAEPVEGQ